MVQTNPQYVFGDNLNFKQTMRCLGGNSIIYYSSFWQWFKKTTLYGGMILLGVGYLLFIMIVMVSLSSPDRMSWGLITAISFLCPLMFLPPVWIVAYYYSFIKKGRMELKVKTFIDKYMPNISEIEQISPITNIVRSCGYDFEVAYTLQGVRVGVKSKIHKFYFIGLRYVPKDEETASKIYSNGDFSEEFVSEWISYCQTRESGRCLMPNLDLIYGMYEEKDLQNDSDIVRKSIDQMLYLCDRFNLVPLNLFKDKSRASYKL